MPHFGLMNPDALGPQEGALQRARLHIRAGKRRLRQGKFSAGFVTLHDALSHAMQWYAFSADGERLAIQPGEDINDDRTLFSILKRSGAIRTRFDFNAFDALVEDALQTEISAFDYSMILKDLENIFMQLGVMPFDENNLPAEDPSTF